MSLSSTTWLDNLRAKIKPEWRETGYRFISGLVMLLFAFGVLAREEAALWTQLGLSVVTTLFAVVFTTSGWRMALYLVLGPLGAVLMWYGLTNDETWALVVSAAGQIFGITTAAAKTIQSSDDRPGKHEKLE